jgi:DHA2 family methylenomycin A resistance protein-like MFS transporter
MVMRVDQAARTTSDRRRGWAFVALCLGFFAVILDVTIVNVALPAIGRSLGGSVTGLQWVANGYNLVFAALLLTAGALCDRWGSKRLFAAGLLVFVAGSLWCGVSPTLGLLVAGRLVQGLGAAMLMPASLALISHTYPQPAQRARAVGAWASVAGAATAVGPVLGGVLVDTVGWRGIFLVNLPIGIVAVLLLARNATESSTRQRGLDLLGQVLGVLLLGSLAVAITEAGQFGWVSRVVLVAAVVTAACLALFVWVERRAEAPMLPGRLLANGTFSAASFVGLLLNFGIYGQVFVLSLYFQHVRGFSALLTGAALLPFAAVTFVGPPLTGRATARFGARPVMVFGQLSAAVGTLLLSLAGSTTPYGQLVIGLFLLGLGFAATMPSLTAAVVLAAPKEYSGIASGVLNAARQVGGVLGVALLGTLVSDLTRFVGGMHVALGIVAGTFALGAVLSLAYVRRPHEASASAESTVEAAPATQRS